MGFFQSIKPTIKYQLGKANIVVDALSRSRGTSNNVEQSGEIDKEVHLMTRSMLVLVEEIKMCHKEQRSDPILAELIRRREEKQDARKEFEFTPQGLLVRL